MDLDLQSIWLHQSVPLVVTKALDTISEQVFYKITDEDRQYCNRNLCTICSCLRGDAFYDPPAISQQLHAAHDLLCDELYPGSHGR